MALVEVGGAAYPTTAEIRDAILRTKRLAYVRRGKKINVLPGSDAYFDATAIAEVISIAFANGQITLADVNPLTTTGTRLRLLCKVFGVSERPMAGSSGYIIVSCVGTVVIPEGYICTAASGAKYKTTAIATATNGDLVQVVAVSTGTATDQDAGAILGWDSAAVGGLKSTCTVYVGGLTGGSDGDTDETLRARLIDRIAFPGAGGNWPQVKKWAEDASASIKAAYVYQAPQGPCSVGVAVEGVEDDGVLGQTVVNLAASAIAANYPGNVTLNVTSIVAEQVDIVIAAQLPLPQSAGGIGGGWRDAVPWPSDNTTVTTVNANLAVVQAVAAPVQGMHIALWSKDDQEMREFVLAGVVDLGAGAYGLTMVPLQPGDTTDPSMIGGYVSAGAENLVSYVATVLEQMKALGPGEKSNSPDIIPRALRKPTADVVAQAALNSPFLSAISNAHSEIVDLAWAGRFATGTVTPLTMPSVPPTTTDPPRKLVLGHFAIRKA